MVLSTYIKSQGIIIKRKITLIDCLFRLRDAKRIILKGNR